MGFHQEIFPDLRIIIKEKSDHKEYLWAAVQAVFPANEWKNGEQFGFERLQTIKKDQPN
jgi:hypothetical protein